MQNIESAIVPISARIFEAIGRSVRYPGIDIPGTNIPQPDKVTAIKAIHKDIGTTIAVTPTPKIAPSIPKIKGPQNIINAETIIIFSIILNNFPAF